MGKSFDIMLLGCFFTPIKYKSPVFSTYLTYITRFDRLESLYLTTYKVTILEI